MTVYPSLRAADNLEQHLDQLLEVDPFNPAASFVEDVIADLSSDLSSLETTDFDRFGPRTYVVGDAGRRDEDGYIWVIGRVDDVIDGWGHRLPTAEIESALVSRHAVAEAAVVGGHDELTGQADELTGQADKLTGQADELTGQADKLTGQAIVAFVTVRAGVATDAALEAELRERVAERIGKPARPKKITSAHDLPKTRSAKIARRQLRRSIRRPRTRRHHDPRRSLRGCGA